MRNLWVRLILVLVTAIIFTSVVRVSYSTIMWHSNVVSLDKIGARSIDRINRTADSVLETLRSLHLAGISRCNESAVEKIREISLLSGYIKDVQVLGVDKQLLCSGSQGVISENTSQFFYDTPYAATAGRIFFYDVMHNNLGLVGISRNITERKTFVAIVNLESLLVNYLPTQIALYTRADVVLGGDVEVASLIPAALKGVVPDEVTEVISKSDRYPLEMRLTVDMDGFLVWNHGFEQIVNDVSLVVGLILGGMLLVVFGRPLTVGQKIEFALQQGEFVPFMQPTFDIRSGKIVGCEVLMRWIKSDGRIIPPLEFIPHAESSGMIVLMTRIIMRDALAKLRPHMLADRNFKVAFNIIPSDMLSDLFVPAMCSLMREMGVSPFQIVFEITERQEFSDQQQAIEVIKSLRKFGFEVALDDTGAGHNGLTNVQQLGADIIKIDKIFIDRIDVDKSAKAIVKMLVQLAAELNMRTLAEGIETEDQLQTLNACGVGQGQGYLVSKPLAYGAFKAMLWEKEISNSVEQDASKMEPLTKAV